MWYSIWQPWPVISSSTPQNSLNKCLGLEGYFHSSTHLVNECTYCMPDTEEWIRQSHYPQGGYILMGEPMTKWTMIIKHQVLKNSVKKIKQHEKTRSDRSCCLTQMVEKHLHEETEEQRLEWSKGDIMKVSGRRTPRYRGEQTQRLQMAMYLPNSRKSRDQCYWSRSHIRKKIGGN